LPGSAQVRAHIEGHVPSDARKRASTQRFLAELGQVARPFDSEADRVHVTTSAAEALRGALRAARAELERIGSS
jgi:glutamate-1-semialdehyde aminotransferase